MAFTKTVDSSIQLETTSIEGANLSSTLYVSPHMYFEDRMVPYSSVTELRDDNRIPSNSAAYAALLAGFSQSDIATPIYLGRHKADELILSLSSVTSNKLYGLTVTVIDESGVLDNSTVEVQVDSGLSADSDTILTALQVELDAISGIVATYTTGNESVLVTSESGYTFLISDLAYLVDDYTTTESAEDMLSELMDENEQDWYFLDYSNPDGTFLKELSLAIEATDGLEYPKQLHVTSDDVGALTALQDPPIDILGELAATLPLRTVVYWSHQEKCYDNVRKTVFQGNKQAGATDWKYMDGVKFVEDVQDPTTGKTLKKTLKGYLSDRNLNYQAKEHNISLAQGGATISGEWIDVVRAKDWVNDQIIIALLVLFTAGRVTNTQDGALKVKNAVNGVLKNAVDLGILEGFVPCTVPTEISFSDKASRILRDVNWTGYLAGSIHFVIVNGILTYSSAELV